MDNVWFKAKRYGWGWVPSSWQGWLATLVYIAIIVYNFWRIDHVSYSASDTLITFIPQAFFISGIFVWICIKKGEKASWKWGAQ
jgi:hypothetical protein